MSRVGHYGAAVLSLRHGASQMFRSERPIKGYVEPHGYDKEDALEFWITNSIITRMPNQVTNRKSKNRYTARQV